MGATQSRRKQFIILFGPAGSGKSFAAETFLKDELQVKCPKLNSNCLKDKEYFFAGVDTYVEKDDDFNKAMKQYEEDAMKLVDITLQVKTCLMGGPSYHNVTNCTDSLAGIKTIEAEMDKLAQTMTKIYFDIRNSKGYNTMNEKNIVENIKQNHNIIFEITGQNLKTLEKICDGHLFTDLVVSQTTDTAKQYYNENIQKHDYEISVVVPYTSYKELRKRLLNRYKTAVERKEAARLTPTNETSLENNERQAFDNLLYLINQGCVDRIVVYDNNTHNLVKSVSIDKVRDKSLRSCIRHSPLGTEDLKISSTNFTEFLTKTCQ